MNSPVQNVISALAQTHRRNHVPIDPTIFSQFSFEQVLVAAHQHHSLLQHYSHLCNLFSIFFLNYILSNDGIMMMDTHGSSAVRSSCS